MMILILNPEFVQRVFKKLHQILFEKKTLHEHPKKPTLWTTYKKYIKFY